MPKRARRKNTVRQQAEDARAVALDARQRQWHMTKQQALDPLMASQLGRLLRDGAISEVQYAAGVSFGEHLRAWAVANNAPHPTPKTISYFLVSGGYSDNSGPIEDHRTRGINGRVHRMMEALAQVEPIARDFVWRVCVEEQVVRYMPEELGKLREGLNAVARGLRGDPFPAQGSRPL
jgi:hypothetical protein